MLDHVSITVTDIGAAEKFYDAIMSALGVPKVRKSDLRLGYGERCDGDHPDRNYLSIKIGDQPDDAPVGHPPDARRVQAANSTIRSITCSMLRLSVLMITASSAGVNGDMSRVESM